MAYRIESTGIVRDRVVQLLAEANALGQGKKFRNGVVQLHTDLAANPHTAGELKYHTRMGFPVYSAASGTAAITYVVYESRQAVCIIKIDRLQS